MSMYLYTTSYITGHLNNGNDFNKRMMQFLKKSIPKPYVLSKIWPGQATIMNKKIAGREQCSPNAYCL